MGPELDVPEKIPIGEIAGRVSPVLGEAVARMRRGETVCTAGFDGEYGAAKHPVQRRR